MRNEVWFFLDAHSSNNISSDHSSSNHRRSQGFDYSSRRTGAATTVGACVSYRWCVSTRVSRWCCYFCSSLVSYKLLAKNSHVLKCRHFDFVTPVTSFFTWHENDLSKNCKARPSVSNAVYRLSLACFVLYIYGGRLFAPSPVGTKVAQTPVGARVNICSRNSWHENNDSSRPLNMCKSEWQDTARSNEN